MEKVREYESKSTDIVHEFFCDECGIKIGETTECEDGWYPECGRYCQSFYMPGEGWYSIKKHFCTNCANNYNMKLKEMLKNFGFSKE